MAGVTGIGILYLIAKSIQIDCSYCILEGNAIPLNTCFQQSSKQNSYFFNSYKYKCTNDSNNRGIYRIDYTNYNCDINDAYQRQYQINNIAQFGCSDNINTEVSSEIPFPFIQSLASTCTSNEYTIIEKENTYTGKKEQKGLIINKCIPYSSENKNTSHYIQCNNDPKQLQIWQFNDNACTKLNSINTYPLNQWYEYRSTNLISIDCPICDVLNISYDKVNGPINGQRNIKSNYVIFDDKTYQFPQPIDICNKFRSEYVHGSYKYVCIRNEIWKAIWTDSTICEGLYTDMISLPNIIDYNCLNYRQNIFGYGERLQSSYIQLKRYNAINCQYDPLNFEYISYITNNCIQQNANTYIIIECQSIFMTVHYYSDNECKSEIAQCMSLWKSNTCNLINNLYFEVIKLCVGEQRTFAYYSAHDHMLDIDSDYTTTTTQGQLPLTNTYNNYISIDSYPEAVNECNEYSIGGVKHSYKYVCIYDGQTGNRKIKKRNWIGIKHCDKYGAKWDEEFDTYPNEYECDYDDIDIEIVQINCFISNNYFKQKTILLNSCIPINHNQNSLYIACYSQFTVTWYYHHNDCTYFDHKEKWYGVNCESRYSEFLLDCNKLTNDSSTTTYSPTIYNTNPAILPTLYPIPTTLPTITSNTNPSLSPIPTTISPLSPATIPTLTPTILPSYNPSISPVQTSTLKPSMNPSIRPSINPSIKPSINPSINPTLRPSVRPSINPTVRPSINPTLKPTINPTKRPSINPSITPSINPTLRPSITPSINPSNNPSQRPTTTPPVTGPTTSPSIKPSINPSQSPTIRPTPTPINPTISPSNNPSLTPIPQPTISPVTSSPTPPPTSRFGASEFYVAYNESRQYWSEQASKYSQYGQIIFHAMLLALENITEHSMNYTDQHLWLNKPWNYAGITDGTICFVFNFKMTANCPSKTIREIHIWRQSKQAQYAAAGRFYVVADSNAKAFRDYIFAQLNTQSFFIQINKILDQLVTAATPTHTRRLLSDNENENKTDETIVAGIWVIDISNLTYSPTITPTTTPTVVPETAKPTRYKPTKPKPTYHQVDNTEEDEKNNLLPMPYRGVIVDTPVVIGDIIIISTIVLFGMILLAGCCFVWKRTKL